MRAGRWEQRTFLAHEATDKILSVIGFGHIGCVVCDRARGLHMRILAHSPRIPRELAASIGVPLVALDELLARADIVTCDIGAGARAIWCSAGASPASCDPHRSRTTRAEVGRERPAKPFREVRRAPRHAVSANNEA